MHYWLLLIFIIKINAQPTYFDKTYGFKKRSENTIVNSYLYKAFEIDSFFVLFTISIKPDIREFTNYYKLIKKVGML